MKIWHRSVLILAVSTLLLSQDPAMKTFQLKAKDPGSAFGYPAVELHGRVAEIFSFDNAEWISGLTCRISYNGKQPLPSKVYFSEYDENGKLISERTRLIYPKLNPGERGKATFRINGSPATIIIWSEGDGPWENPY